MRILVADDNDVSRELLREILEAAGHEVFEALDGIQTVQQVRAVVPDLMLLDIQMPGVDGYAVLAELRRDPRFRRLPVLAVTAYAMEGDRERALASGFEAYITKPVEPAQVRREIERSIRLIRARSASA